MRSIPFFDKASFYLIAVFAASFLIALITLEAAAALLFLLWLADPRKFKISYNHPVLYLFAAFVLFRIISAAFSPWQEIAWTKITKELLIYFAVPSLWFYLNISAKDKRENLIRIFFYAGVLVSLYAVVTFGLGLYPRAQSVTSGFATYSNYTLFILAAGLSAAGFFRLKSFITESLVLTLLMSGIFLSLGRMNIAIAFAMFLLFIVLGRLTVKTILLTAAMTTVICFTLFNLNTTELSNRAANPAGLSDRDVLIKEFLSKADQHPVTGFGPDTFNNVFEKRDQLADKKVSSWHNELIQVYMESGLPAVLALLGIYFSILMSGVKSAFRRNSDDDQKLKAGFFFGTGALFLAVMTSGMISTPDLSLMFVFITLFYHILNSDNQTVLNQ